MLSKRDQKRFPVSNHSSVTFTVAIYMPKE